MAGSRGERTLLSMLKMGIVQLGLQLQVFNRDISPSNEAGKCTGGGEM